MNVHRVRNVIDEPIIAAIERSPPEQQLRLLKPFWFVDTSLTLRISYELISALPENPVPDELKWDEKNASFSNDPILSVLAQLRHSSGIDVASAIDLVLLYLTKRPERAGKVLKLLTKAEGFGFDRHSHRNQYAVQRLVVDRVVALADSPHQPALLIEVAKRFLAFEFESHFSEDRSTVTFCHFKLEDCAEVDYIRQTLWGALKKRFRVGQNAEKICLFLLEYGRQHFRYSAADILRSDANELREWADLLDPSAYLHCVVVHTIHRQLHLSDIDSFDAIVQRFSCPAFELRILISFDFQDDRHIALGYQAREQIRADRVFARYGTMSEKDLPGFIALCYEVRNAKDGGNDYYPLRISVIRLFETIGDRDPERLSRLTRAYLKLGDPLDFKGGAWLPTLIRGIGRIAALEIIEIYEFASQQAWLLALYYALEEDETEKADVEHIFRLLEDEALGVPQLGLLRKYERFEPKILPRVVSLVLATRGEQAGAQLNNLFSYLADELDWLRLQFNSDIELLKLAYLTVQSEERMNSSSFDYDARLFSHILDVAPDFIGDYVQQRYVGQRWLSEYNENHRDYECLWARSDWPGHLVELVDAITCATGDDVVGDYLAAWFPRSGGKMRSTLSGPSEEAIFHLIEKRACNTCAMQVLFSTLCSVDARQRLTAFTEFLELNKSLEVFKKLPLVSDHMWTAKGGLLTQHQGRIHFIEQLQGLLSGIEFIGHRAYLNEQIRYIKARITQEEEREFIGDDF